MSKHIHLHIHDSAYSYNGTYNPKDLSEEEKARRNKGYYYRGALFAPNNPTLKDSKKTSDAAKCTCNK